MRPSSSSSTEDVGKSSFYVWFLGSRESKGLRGEEFTKPAVRSMILANRAKSSANSVKLTLQISSKGVKIVQTPDRVGGKRRQISSSSNDPANQKQFIAHSSITCVYQGDAPHDDVVSCIFLVSGGSQGHSNECPLYVHAFRCDSAETASHLRAQLQLLVERPENLAKYDEIEARLAEKGLLSSSGHKSKFSRSNSANSSAKLGSDGRSVGRSSDSDCGGGLPPRDRLVTLYDSLAAELREKLANKGAHPPLLLPPRDYDTIHRGKGNLSNIDKRRALNPAIVGSPDAGLGGSEGSSGIGSDENHRTPSSPEEVEKYSSDDDDWPHVDMAAPESRDPGVKSKKPPPLVSIQAYEERGAKKAANVAKEVRPRSNVQRKSSFHELQQKFKEMECLPKKTSDVNASTNKKLESYLSRRQGGEEGSNKVKRQVSKCSSIVKPAPAFKRNMEAVGEFEKVWQWADDDDNDSVNDVPLTKELSPEYRRSEQRSRPGGALSPVERKSRARTPEVRHKLGPQRGLSSPAELRRPIQPFAQQHLPPPPHLRARPGPPLRRAASPDVLRRSSSRGGAMSPEPVRILRREKTSVFDNRYPSLDLRSDKRKSLYELKEDVARVDFRRRSYHELSNPELLMQQQQQLHHNFYHNGKKSKDAKKIHRHPPAHVMPMPHPPPPHPAWIDPRAFPYPPMAPHHHHPHHHPAMPPPPPHMGRFGIAPIQQY